MSINKQKWSKSARISLKVLWNLLLIFTIFGLITFSFAGAVGAGYFASLLKDEPIRTKENMKKDIYNYEETTELYFTNDIYLGKLRSDLYRNEVKLDQVSKFVKDAVVATEDQYFYEHNGVVPKSILRAIYQEFTNSTIKSGGSTLTQQLIKNQILTNEVSFERKAKEIMLALRLEKFFDKDQILEAYLNVVPFGRNSSGRNIAGVEAAAQGIFGVAAKDLNLPQSAYIAGLPQSPFGYTPFTNKGEIKNSIEPSLNRMKTVLTRMLGSGMITEEQYRSALAYDIKGHLTPPKPSPIKNYPWLTFEIEKRAVDIMAKILAEKDGYTDEDLQNDKDLKNEYLIKSDRNLRRNGYKIYTTIDKNIYDVMQEVKNNFNDYGKDKPETVINPQSGDKERILEPVQVGAILIENKSGRIISFVGGRDFQKEQLNHAMASKRSNGSTMKPLLVYAPAMENGTIQPGSPLADVPLKFQTGTSTWQPENYGGKVHGLTTARDALAASYNIPAAKVYADIINSGPIAYLETMGFTSLTKGDASHLSMALGGLDKGVTVEENVNAYTTFANNGEFIDSYMIEKIVSKDGETVYQHQAKPTYVFSPQTAYLTIDMMRDVIKRGTAAGLPSKLDFQTDWAGKTGTSQDFHDAWLVATNPNVTFGTWIGYDTPKVLESYRGNSYSTINQMIWAQLLNASYKVKPDLIAPKETFKMPGGIVRRSYCSLSGLLPSKLCEEAGFTKTDLFNAKYVPTEKDNSLVKGKFVNITGKTFEARPETPAEFTSDGIMITQAYLDKMGLDKLTDSKQLFPNYKNIIVPEKADFQDLEKTPSPVANVRLNGNELSWNKGVEDDIVGYSVYQAKNQNDSYRKIASVSNESFYKVTYTVDQPNAQYYVTAVDILGKESGQSMVVGQAPKQNQPLDPKPKTDPKPKQDPKPKTDPKPKQNKDKKKDAILIPPAEQAQ